MSGRGTKGKESVWVGSNAAKKWQDARREGEKQRQAEWHPAGEQDEQALTDTGRLDAGPGEIWQAEPGGGALQ